MVVDPKVVTKIHEIHNADTTTKDGDVNTFNGGIKVTPLSFLTIILV